MTEETKVPGGTEAGVPEGTPAPGEVAKATPTQPPQDAGSAKYEAELAKYKEDLNKLKSASQKRESELQRALAQREREFQQKIEETRLASMDDDERKIYEVERNKERVAELEAELQAARLEKEEMVAYNNAYAFFAGKGVPPSELILDQGLDALVASGWDFVSKRLAELEAQVTQMGSTQKVLPKEPPKAPPVETGTGIPVGGPTWEDLEKKYGSREAVYTLIEQRRLSPDILPK